MSVLWPEKLARAILWRAAKDMTPERGAAWLTTKACQSLCAQAEIDYKEYASAVRYLLDKSSIQRAVMLQNLKKHIGA